MNAPVIIARIDAAPIRFIDRGMFEDCAWIAGEVKGIPVHEITRCGKPVGPGRNLCREHRAASIARRS